ncbi:MAG: hypothetical protein H0V76_10550 [Blastocatellia bacterium]|nr:hypothetical protein [Blastocatellia bacterium]
MKLAYRVFILTLTFTLFATAAFAQVDSSRRSANDDRNTAPTVGTGGPMGGPTGLFTVYDGQTLRRGEHTFSFAISNYDRDPGNVDITEVPVSFQIGVTNSFELYFNTDAYRAIKVNSPGNLSSFYLPNSQINGVSRGAIVLAPGVAGTFSNQAVFRPAGSPFAAFPFIGANAGTFGVQFPNFSGPLFGFPAGTNAQLGPITTAGDGAAQFRGIGSVFGSILPGLVLQTTNVVPAPGGPGVTVPTSFTTAPSYLPDAPFINRTYGETSLNTFTAGFKWRWTDINAPVGFGMVFGYRWNYDTAHSARGFNQMQRGSGPGARWDRGDFLVTMFADARLARWANLSVNAGYHLNSQTRGDFGGGDDVVLLDRPDELLLSAALDFPVNKYFQPILEFRSLRYVGGRTPNVFENHPYDGIAGFRVFPQRWFGLGFAYRYHFNQQNSGSFDDDSFTTGVTVPCVSGTGSGCTPLVVNNTFSGVPPGFQLSSDAHGYIVQFLIGRRDLRAADVVNEWANVTALNLSRETLRGPGCPVGTQPVGGVACDDNFTIDVATTAVDPENDPLVYNYTVSGGRIVGSGANVQWDLTGVSPGTYTITAGVDDGCGICGQTQTRTVTVAACECQQRCECPSISVTGPAGITAPGETMNFTANVVGGGAVTYNWSVNRGTIESGQGTPSITVRTSSADAASNVTATVNIGGLDPACDCPATASDSGPVDDVPQPILVDEFGALQNDDIRARLDQFFIELQNNPTNQGYVINYGTNAQITARERLITNHITLRRFDRSRITLVRGGDAGIGVNTRLYRVPPGADNPTP